MFGRKKGAEGLILQELCQFEVLTVCNMADSAYFVKSTAPSNFGVSF